MLFTESDAYQENNPIEQAYYFKWMTETSKYVEKTIKKEKKVAKTMKRKIKCKVSDIVENFKKL